MFFDPEGFFVKHLGKLCTVMDLHPREHGEILRIDPQGEPTFGQFEMSRPRHRKTFQDCSDRYLDALIAFGGCCGVSGDEILLLRDVGYSEEEIEELLYDLPELHVSALQAAGR